MNARELWPTTLLGAAMFAIMAVPGQSVAQAADSAQQDARIHLAQAAVDDGTIEKFADAFVEVQRVREALTVELQRVEDEDKANAMVQEARNEMVAAVEDKGLSVDEYNQVANQMDSNPDLRERVVAALEERSPEE